VIRESKSLRDVRHLDKLLYTLSGPLFYEPFESRYSPSDEHHSAVLDVLRELGRDWLVSREGSWFYANPRQVTLPAQGWKIHISTAFENRLSVLRKSARIAIRNDVPFKFALDKNILGMMGSKRWKRGSSGKFLTLYPLDSEHFREFLDQLYAELHLEEGPYILSDRRYKDCRALYYRYGGIARTVRLDITGQKVLVLVSPDGQAVPDQRTPYFSPPSWVTDPFPAQKHSSDHITLNRGRYLVRRALSFSNSGGVYLAQDSQTGFDVVVKEARPHTVLDGQGVDAVTRLRKEWAILELLRSSGVTPIPVELFEEWENVFLVEEYIEGTDLRKLVLTHSPLMFVNPSLNDGVVYHGMYKTICRSLCDALNTLHERNIVFGDVSPKNFIIDPATFAVRLIDLEVAVRVGADTPTDIHTPGFKSAVSIQHKTQGFEDDAYGLAALMVYMLFPIAALSALRSDLFDSVLRTLLTDIGWIDTELIEVIQALSQNKMTLTQAREQIGKSTCMRPPYFTTHHIDTESLEKIRLDLGEFILTNIEGAGSETLFPADPFVHQTNPFSLGFGACGVLYALHKSGFAIPQRAYEWLVPRLDTIRRGDLPPGLLTGLSGLAWCASELGLEDRAVEFMFMANESAILHDNHSYFYGMAGVGIANLAFFNRTRNPYYLACACELAGCLLQTAKEDETGLHWDADKLIHIGFGYGQSGVAMFLLRLYQCTGNETFLSHGRNALNFDLCHGVEHEHGVISFPNRPADTTLLPYLEEGSAGIAKVAIRYGLWDSTDKILAETHRKYAGSAGLLYGLGSFVDVLTDAYVFSGDAKFLKMAERPISGIHDVYLMSQAHGAATPGEGLFRISCDYATGVAGVMRTLHRFTRADHADFVLDGHTFPLGTIGGDKSRLSGICQ